jgi:hypothetical protein
VFEISPFLFVVSVLLHERDAYDLQFVVVLRFAYKQQNNDQTTTHDASRFDAFVQQVGAMRSSLKKSAVLNCFNGDANAFDTYTRRLDLFVVVGGLLVLRISNREQKFSETVSVLLYRACSLLGLNRLPSYRNRRPQNNDQRGIELRNALVKAPLDRTPPLLC